MGIGPGVFSLPLSSLLDGHTSEPPSLVRGTHDPGGSAGQTQTPPPGTAPYLRSPLTFCPQPSAKCQTPMDKLCGQPGAGRSREVLSRMHMAPAFPGLRRGQGVGGRDRQGGESTEVPAPLWSHAREPCPALGPAKLSPCSGPTSLTAWEHAHCTESLHSSICGLREAHGELGVINVAFSVCVNKSFPVPRSDSPLLPS